MIIKTFLAALGFGAAPEIHNQVVHDARNARAALLAGHARIIRLSAAADRAAIEGRQDVVTKTANRQSEVRAALEDIARRLV